MKGEGGLDEARRQLSGIGLDDDDDDEVMGVDGKDGEHAINVKEEDEEVVGMEHDEDEDGAAAAAAAGGVS